MINKRRNGKKISDKGPFGGQKETQLTRFFYHADATEQMWKWKMNVCMIKQMIKNEQNMLPSNRKTKYEKKIFMQLQKCFFMHEFPINQKGFFHGSIFSE